MFPKIEINFEDRSILTDTFFNISVSWRSTLKFFTGIVRKPGVLVLGWGFGIILTVVFEFVSSKFSISARIFLIFYYSTERLSFSAKVWGLYLLIFCGTSNFIPLHVNSYDTYITWIINIIVHVKKLITPYWLHNFHDTKLVVDIKSNRICKDVLTTFLLYRAKVIKHFI